MRVMILAVMLSRLHYQVIEASDGLEGIDKAVAESPDLIIMDLGLPGIDGLETTVRLKQNPKTAHIPVVAHTIWSEHQNDIKESRLKRRPASCLRASRLRTRNRRATINPKVARTI
jgi:CheY-like chemotaxis protein